MNQEMTTSTSWETDFDRVHDKGVHLDAATGLLAHWADSGTNARAQLALGFGGHLAPGVVLGGLLDLQSSTVDGGLGAGLELTVYPNERDNTSLSFALGASSG